MTKKLRERAIVEAFLESKLVPGASLEEWDRERPDAIIRVDGRLIAIEITTLTEVTQRQPTAPQKWTVEAGRVVKVARTMFESSSSRPLVVEFQFRPDWVPPDKRAAARLASELAAIVEGVVQRVAPDSTKPVTLKDPHDAVSWAYIGSTRAELGGRWEPSFGFEGMRASIQDIASTVARKEAEVAKYRQVASEVWLLIDCNLTGQGVAFYPPEADLEIVTGFGRVFCCGFGRWEWVEVRCVPQGPVAARDT
jgi:hypothetical protein